MSKYTIICSFFLTNDKPNIIENLSQLCYNVSGVGQIKYYSYFILGLAQKGGSTMKEFNAVLDVAEKAAMVIDIIVPAVRKVISILGE